MNEDKWIALSKIESEIYEDTLKLLKPVVDKVLEEKILEEYTKLIEELF